MANVTITIDDDTLRRARIHALEHGTSLNAIVRSYLERLVGDDPSKEAGAALVALSEEVSGSSGPEGRTWRREDLYEDL